MSRHKGSIRVTVSWTYPNGDKEVVRWAGYPGSTALPHKLNKVALARTRAQAYRDPKAGRRRRR